MGRFFFKRQKLRLVVLPPPLATERKEGSPLRLTHKRVFQRPCKRLPGESGSDRATAMVRPEHISPHYAMLKSMALEVLLPENPQVTLSPLPFGGETWEI